LHVTKSRFALVVQDLIALMLILIVAIMGNARAQDTQPTFKPEEIEALVAPIALYPDSLLSQVLMASTYPLEVVQAARWVEANPNVKGDAAVKAVESQTWDVSVKSLVAFPQILQPMNEKLDWTQKLGDAFLADQKAVLDAVQRLRQRADQSGNLKSNEQQKVIVEQAAPQQTVIKIEPANPQVVYVPAYNPTVVYGAWSYPTYPPYYWPPPPLYYPGGALARGFAWGVGVAAAGAIFGGCNWGRGDVDINVNKAVNIDRNFDRTKVSAGGKWEHDAGHRKGVAYRDTASRERYGKSVPGAEGRGDFRGREGGAGDRAGAGDRGAAGERGERGDRAGAGDRGGAGDRAGAGDRGAAGERGERGDRAGAGDRGGAGDRTGAGDRAGPADRGGAGERAGGDRAGGADRAGAGDRGGGRDNAFQGVGGGTASQRDFDRGRASNQSMAANRGGGMGAGAGAGSTRGGGAGFSGGGGARPSGGFQGGGGARGGGGGRGGGGRR
jgi:hypothetical protein